MREWRSQAQRLPARTRDETGAGVRRRLGQQARQSTRVNGLAHCLRYPQHTLLFRSSWPRCVRASARDHHNGTALYSDRTCCSLVTPALPSPPRLSSPRLPPNVRPCFRRPWPTLPPQILHQYRSLSGLPSGTTRMSRSSSRTRGPLVCRVLPRSTLSRFPSSSLIALFSTRPPCQRTYIPRLASDKSRLLLCRRRWVSLSSFVLVVVFSH